MVSKGGEELHFSAQTGEVFCCMKQLMRKFPFLAENAVEDFLDTFHLSLSRKINDLKKLLKDVSEVCNQILYRPVSF